MRSNLGRHLLNEWRLDEGCPTGINQQESARCQRQQGPSQLNLAGRRRRLWRRSGLENPDGSTGWWSQRARCRLRQAGRRRGQGARRAAYRPDWRGGGQAAALSPGARGLARGGGASVRGRRVTPEGVSFLLLAGAAGSGRGVAPEEGSLPDRASDGLLLAVGFGLAGPSGRLICRVSGDWPDLESRIISTCWIVSSEETSSRSACARSAASRTPNFTLPCESTAL